MYSPLVFLLGVVVDLFEAGAGNSVASCCGLGVTGFKYLSNTIFLNTMSTCF